MKKKLTLSMDKEFIPKAKQYASAHGMSLSELIETTLKKLTHITPISFSSKWKGQFMARHQKGARYQALAKRFL